MAQEDVFKKIVSHCKEYGFVFPSSEIYDGLAAVYDYGQNGVELKNNIKQYWWQSMVLLHENIVGLDASIFMHPTVWKASGHVDAFNDPLIDNRDSSVIVLMCSSRITWLNTKRRLLRRLLRQRSVSATALMRLSSVLPILVFSKTRRSMMNFMLAILRLCRVLTWRC